MKYTNAQKKLAMKWAKGEVTHASVQRAFKKSSVGAYVALALILREVVNERMWD